MEAFSFAIACVNVCSCCASLMKPVMSSQSFSARYSWLVSCSLARANARQSSRYSASVCSVARSRSSHSAALALAFSTSDSFTAFVSCFPSFFPFLSQDTTVRVSVLN
ncbi:hypothetical protein EYF80_032891 [Liparis tanakae]|uniref:Uncharacterized protein n=1 Tax=Liparis tanakae TaxID=230148 RepID=A0A4Z2GU82_9TELE|nr:hypothetical protein EYF80_032891 [Liparis tanakae]